MSRARLRFYVLVCIAGDHDRNAERIELVTPSWNEVISRADWCAHTKMDNVVTIIQTDTGQKWSWARNGQQTWYHWTPSPSHSERLEDGLTIRDDDAEEIMGMVAS